MHLRDTSVGFLGSAPIVAGTISLALGAALAVKIRDENAVVVSFFGDGATNIGYFHEAVNLAAVWKLPVVFLCENNQYGMGTAVERASAVPEMLQKAAAYQVPGDRVDGMDLLAVHAATQRAIAHARSGNGPYFLEAVTYRYRGHSMGDPERYRKADEIRKWQEGDPIGRMEKVLVGSGVTAAVIEETEKKVEAEISEAVRFAEGSPFPPQEELWTDIYAEASTA